MKKMTLVSTRELEKLQTTDCPTLTEWFQCLNLTRARAQEQEIQPKQT